MFLSGIRFALWPLLPLSRSLNLAPFSLCFVFLFHLILLSRLLPNVTARRLQLLLVPFFVAVVTVVVVAAVTFICCSWSTERPTGRPVRLLCGQVNVFIILLIFFYVLRSFVSAAAAAVALVVVVVIVPRCWGTMMKTITVLCAARETETGTAAGIDSQPA